MDVLGKNSVSVSVPVSVSVSVFMCLSKSRRTGQTAYNRLNNDTLKRWCSKNVFTFSCLEYWVTFHDSPYQHRSTNGAASSWTGHPRFRARTLPSKRMKFFKMDTRPNTRDTPEVYAPIYLRPNPLPTLRDLH